MTGVIYARYSSDNQREESIEGQIHENTAFAEKNGIVFVGHYIDRSVSTKINNRLFFYPSRRLGISLTHGVRRISSAPVGLDIITHQRAFLCDLMRYNTAC